jgi:DNA-binding response OmpR family regulator
MFQPAVTSVGRSELLAPIRRNRLVPRKRGPLILLVEDDSEMRAMIARMLRKDGYDVVECADGDSAFDWLGDGVFDGYYERLPAVIVSDVRLPYFDGFEILETMHEARTQVPTILITAFPDQDVYRRAYDLGARSVLAKPFDLEELRTIIWTTLEPATRPISPPSRATRRASSPA